MVPYGGQRADRDSEFGAFRRSWPTQHQTDGETVGAGKTVDNVVAVQRACVDIYLQVYCVAFNYLFLFLLWQYIE